MHITKLLCTGLASVDPFANGDLVGNDRREVDILVELAGGETGVVYDFVFERPATKE